MAMASTKRISKRIREKLKILIAGIFALNLGCATTLLPPTHKKYTETTQFNFVWIPEYKKVSSTKAGLYANEFSAFGEFQKKELDPGSIMEGILLKKGLDRIQNIPPQFRSRTLLVKYGISGRREVGLGGYTQEVTIKLVRATDQSPVFLCTAEGIGSTEVDDIRVAITRCLSGY